MGAQGQPRAAIIGGGISGLTVAYYLTRAGWAVEVFESAARLGGLASSFRFGEAIIERYYHFICGGDHALIGLCRDLGIADVIRWQAVRTSHFYDGNLYPFSSAGSLLRFTPLSLPARIRLGIHAVRSRRRQGWLALDEIPAKVWLLKHTGERAYEVIWRPLLEMKFGDWHDQISAAWLWHRFHRVATSRRNLAASQLNGYLAGGTETLIQCLRGRIEDSRESAIHVSEPVRAVVAANADGVELSGSTWSRRFDAVVSAVPIPVLAEILPSDRSDYQKQLRSITFLGVVCAVMRLRRSVTDSFWVNVNDARVPFCGFIEYTRLNPCPRYGGDTIVYVPFYVRTDSELFRQDDSQIRDLALRGLCIVNPDIKPDDLRDWAVHRDAFAQPVCTTGFARRVPSVTTPIPGLYMMDAALLYPADRNLSSLVVLAHELAATIQRRARPAAVSACQGGRHCP
jgi:protoporphyrinogen oxidase